MVTLISMQSMRRIKLFTSHDTCVRFKTKLVKSTVSQKVFPTDGAQITKFILSRIAKGRPPYAIFNTFSLSITLLYQESLEQTKVTGLPLWLPWAGVSMAHLDHMHLASMNSICSSLIQRSILRHWLLTQLVKHSKSLRRRRTWLSRQGLKIWSQKTW